MKLKARSRQALRFAAVRRKIRGRLNRAAGADPHFWDFRDNADAIASKKLFQYPAMMVPALQKQVIAALLHRRPDVQTILDPFLGSGTILALAMLNGRSFVGQDINPLSILIAKTRAYSLDHLSLSTAAKQVSEEAEESSSRLYAVRFVGQSKWFTKEASIGLSRLREAIRRQPAQTVRRFLWVCLAETVRLNSNSRTSTFKLHIKPEDQRNATIHSVLSTFKTISIRNAEIVKEFATTLSKAGFLDENLSYNRPIQIVYGDSAKTLPTIHWTKDGKCDLVVTSPPYGDNRTTVPYGQAAWLPLKWIDFCDIDKGLNNSCAERAYDIDNRSLGGARQRKLYSERMSTLEKVGSKTKAYIGNLTKLDGDGDSRFVHFAFDLKKVLDLVAACCKVGSRIVITLGHRNIAQTVCPLTDVCTEILSYSGIKEMIRIDRQIPSKRMPSKNSHSSTINHEYILILHKSV